MARPTKMNPQVRLKIEEAAAIGATDTEIAFYADISRDTLYRWIRDDKKLSDRIEALREKPILKARQAVVQALSEPSHAQWYLERKRKDEFSQRSELKEDVTLKIDV